MMRNKDKNVKNIVSIWSNLVKDETFYVPILGPVYVSGTSAKKILSDLLENTESDVFLPYDKNRRWFPLKTEKIILPLISHNEREIYIPVIDSNKKFLKIFYYSDIPPTDNTIAKAKKIQERMALSYKIYSSNFYCFKKPTIRANFICNSLYLKKISRKDYQIGNNDTVYYNQLPANIRLTLRDFKKEPETENLYYLWKEFISRNKKLGPILCATSENNILGAIGPLDIEQDARGIPFLLPPHFGIIKKARRLGLGKKLWETAMCLAYQQGAKYTLVQNTPDSPASKFYKKQGLIESSRMYICSLDK